MDAGRWIRMNVKGMHVDYCVGNGPKASDTVDVVKKRCKNDNVAPPPLPIGSQLEEMRVVKLDAMVVLRVFLL